MSVQNLQFLFYNVLLISSFHIRCNNLKKTACQSCMQNYCFVCVTFVNIAGADSSRNDIR